MCACLRVKVEQNGRDCDRDRVSGREGKRGRAREPYNPGYSKLAGIQPSAPVCDLSTLMGFGDQAHSGRDPVLDTAVSYCL